MNHNDIYVILVTFVPSVMLLKWNLCNIEAKFHLITILSVKQILKKEFKQL